jgi:transcription elongation GreA/GreB family factor
MEMADWITGISKYQTANLLTPLPATSNWDALKPLNERGELLQPGEMRPYHLYTGRQFVFQDPRWTMRESQELFNRYSAKLSPVDTLYARIFRILRSYQLRLTATRRDLGDTITNRIAEATEVLRGWSDPVSMAGKEFGENLSQRVAELTESLRAAAQPLATARRDLAESVGVRVNELSEALRSLSDPLSSSSKEVAAGISARITELSDMLNRVVVESPRPSTQGD